MSAPAYRRVARQAAASTKSSRGRRAVLDVLQQANDLPDAITVYERARQIDPKLCLASVYRALKMLLASDVVRRHQFAGRRAVWELARAERHAHLIDVRSGEILELPDADVLRIHQAAAAALGYRLIDAKVELYAERLKP
ncbi:MAG TPA: Fur family transcriptional regulator [Vineibacter sp.]|nr:Fur family transcriptional regulator [Vineibacter sp.]